MSNTRRARPRRYGGRYHDLFDEHIAVLCGWSDVEHVEEAKRKTHDTLIRMLGDNRTGSVSWRLIDDVPAALAQLERMREGADEPHMELYDRLEALLREHGDVLVIATAPGRPPTPPRSDR